MTVAAAFWIGPVPNEARAAHHRARESGMSALRALVVGNVASFKDCWMFRSRLAKHLGCSVRTVQRALSQATELGLIGKARAKQGEKPPGLDTVVPCGWSHRWTIGWGRAGAEVKAAIARARAKWMTRHAVAPTSTVAGCSIDRKCPPAPRVAPRRWTAAELDAELEHAARNAPPPEKPPPERG